MLLCFPPGWLGRVVAAEDASAVPPSTIAALTTTDPARQNGFLRMVYHSLSGVVSRQRPRHRLCRKSPLGGRELNNK
jgi:hypothetical protein